jgi:hypothetical protein
MGGNSMSDVFTEEMVRKKLSGYKKFAVVTTIILVIFGVYVGANSYLRANDILSDHSAVQATVTKTEYRQEEGKKGRLKDVYEVFYSFSQNGSPVNGSFRTNQEKFIQYRSSGVVEIAYSNKNPAEFDRLELLKSQSSLSGLLSRMAIFLVACIVFFGLLGLIIRAMLNKKVGSPI